MYLDLIYVCAIKLIYEPISLCLIKLCVSRFAKKINACFLLFTHFVQYLL